MKLGEFRTKTRDLDNKLDVKLSIYGEFDGHYGIADLDIDIATNHCIYLRIIKED